MSYWEVSNGAGREHGHKTRENDYIPCVFIPHQPCFMREGNHMSQAGLLGTSGCLHCPVRTTKQDSYACRDASEANPEFISSWDHADCAASPSESPRPCNWGMDKTRPPQASLVQATTGVRPDRSNTQSSVLPHLLCH